MHHGKPRYDLYAHVLYAMAQHSLKSIYFDSDIGLQAQKMKMI